MSKQPRSLARVIDALCKVAPDLTEHFRWLRKHVAYTPPETMGDNWNMAMQILQAHASEHPQQEKLAAIFGDKIALDEILGPEGEEPYIIGECGGPEIVLPADIDRFKATLFEIIEIALHSKLTAEKKVGWMGNLAQQALHIVPPVQKDPVQAGNKVYIKSNLRAVLTRLEFEEGVPERMHERFAGTLQEAHAVWVDEPSQVTYVTVDLCCEIPAECCIVVR